MLRLSGVLLLLCLAFGDFARAQVTLPPVPVAPDINRVRLQVSADGRHLSRRDGRPFLWLGDTAWELLHHASAEEIAFYFKDRGEKRFTVSQIVLVPELNGLTRPNRYGDLPFLDGNPARPNTNWFDLARYAAGEAFSKGIYVAFLPTWGGYVVKDENPLFPGRQLFTPANARAYGRWLGEYFRDHLNVIWMLGGDREPDGYEAVWRELAAGLTEGSAPHNPLITYHPPGPGSSARTLHGEPWLDFHSVQSGHRLDGGAHELIAEAYAMTPPRPVINAEPAYEAIPVNLKVTDGRFTDDQVRRNWYWTIFSGAAGVTYGANEVWMCWSPEIEPVSPKVTPPFLGAQRHWTNALAYPGAGQIKHLRALLESRPWAELEPDATLVVAPKPGGTNHVAGLRARDGGTALLYLPQGGSVTVNLARLAGTEVRGTWWSPKTTGSSNAGTFVPRGEKQLKAPSAGLGEDWVLVLDDPAKSYPPIGQRLRTR